MKYIFTLLAAIGLIAILASCSSQKKYGCPSAVTDSDVEVENTL